MAKYSQKLAIDFRCQYLLHEASAFTLNAILIFYNINLRYFSSLHSRIERQRKSGQISEYCEWTKILGTYRLHLKLKMEIQVWIETTSCLLRKRSKENRLAFSIFFFLWFDTKNIFRWSQNKKSYWWGCRIRKLPSLTSFLFEVCVADIRLSDVLHHWHAGVVDKQRFTVMHFPGSSNS